MLPKNIHTIHVPLSCYFFPYFPVYLIRNILVNHITYAPINEKGTIMPSKIQQHNSNNIHKTQDNVKQCERKQKSTYEYVWFYCSFHRLQLSQLQIHNALNSINTRKHEIILRALIFRVPFTIFRFCDNFAILFSSVLYVFSVQLFWTFLFFVDAAVWLWILDIFLQFGVVFIVFQSFIAK